MKKKWIILAAVVAILVLIVVVFTLIGKKNTTPAADPDAAYAYSFRNEGKNIVVTIKGNFKEGHTWHVEQPHEAIVKASVNKVNARKTEILLEPMDQGVHTVTLALENDDVLPDRLYEISLVLMVDSDGKLTVLSSTHREFAGKTLYGEDTAHPYEIAENKDGGLTVRLLQATNDERILVSTPDDLLAVNCVAADTGVKAENTEETVKETLYEISPLKAGVCTIYFADITEKQALKLVISVDEDLKMTLDAHENTTYDFAAEQEKIMAAEAEALVGNLTMPAGCTDVSRSVRSLWESDGKEYRAVIYEFSYNGKACLMMAAPGVSPELMRRYTGAADSTGKEEQLADKTVTLYADASALVWLDGTVACGVTADTPETVKTLAESIIKANPAIKGEP